MPTFKSTAKEHSQCLFRRLTQWELGEFDELLLEASTIYWSQMASKERTKEELLAKTFAKLVLVGELTVARKLLDQRSSRGVLPLSQSTYKLAETANVKFKLRIS